MPKVSALLFDFSRVLLHAKDSSYAGKLNDLYRSERSKPGFQFFDFFTLDGELLGWLENQKNSVLLGLYTSEIIQNDLSILPMLTTVFGENIFSGQDLGISKSQPTDYHVIVEKLGVEPGEIVFVDDNRSNVQAAQDAGLQVIQYFSREQVISALSKLVEK